MRAFDRVMQQNPAACASLLQALDEYITPPTMVIVRGEAGDETSQMSVWRKAINQHYYPHHLVIYLDERVQNLPQTLQRDLKQDVNAWVCKGVVCSQEIESLQLLLESI